MDARLLLFTVVFLLPILGGTEVDAGMFIRTLMRLKNMLDAKLRPYSNDDVARSNTFQSKYWDLPFCEKVNFISFNRFILIIFLRLQ